MGITVAQTGYSAGVRRTYGLAGLYGYADGAARDFPHTMGDAAPTVLATSPSGVVQFSDGSIYDPETGTTYDANGNVVASGGPTATEIASLQAQLSQAATDLQTLANAAASNASVGAKINAQLADAQAKLTQAISDFGTANSWWRDLLAATFPPYGLVQAINIGSLGNQIISLRQSIATMQQEASSIQGQQVSITSSSATQYAALSAAARAAGNGALADQYMALATSTQATAANQSQAPNPTTGFLAWVEQNAMWIGIGAAVVFIGPSLVKKL